MGTSQSAISRELKRNTGQRGYRYKQAQGRSDKRRAEAAKAIKMTANMIHFIEAKLRDKWSPEQISGWLMEERQESLSHETIYRHVWTDQVSGGDLFSSLASPRKSVPTTRQQSGRSRTH